MSKLLLVAPTCDRDDVGEAWEAFQWVSRLALRHDVTLLTYHKRGKQPASEQLPSVRVVEWVEPPGLGRAERLNSMLKPGYVPFYFRARRWIKAALADGERFDVAHQLTPLALRYPSPLAGCGVPFVIGPVGGSLESPPGFADDDSAPWYVGLRRLDAWRLRHDRWLRRTFSSASCVVGIADYVRDLLSSIPIQKFIAVTDTGIEEVPPVVDRRGRVGPLRLLYVGRVVRTKGARDAIRALASLTDLPLTFDVIGDGFDRPACDRLVTELGLGDRIVMHGRLPREQVDQFYKDADVFVFPSYREPGGIVVAEAMGYGLPLIVSDRGGPASSVTDACGIRLPVETPEQYAQAIADAIRRLAGDPGLRERMGLAARDRVAEIALWDRKVDRISALYEEIRSTRNQ